MQLDIITLFPEICAAPLGESIPGRAQTKGAVRVRVTNLRSFAGDRRGSVDDKPYGGGAGMVLMAAPLFEAVEAVRTPAAKVVLLTPQGRRFTQAIAQDMADNTEHLVLVCGHYEGVDERARQALFDEELSIGDYILTNGAIAAAVVADAVIRLLPGVLGSDESPVDETFGNSELLEYPQYTRPAIYRNMEVPQVLLSGDHERIETWRRKQRIVRTAARRPDLLRRQTETE